MFAVLPLVAKGGVRSRLWFVVESKHILQLNSGIIQKELEMKNLRVLFISTHNGARSQIAEEFAKIAAGGRIESYSASFDSENIGPIPVAIADTFFLSFSVMEEIGIALQSSPPKSVFERIKKNECFDYVIALCDPASPEHVTIFLSAVDKLYHKTSKRLNWSIQNFRSKSCKNEDRKTKARQIRDEIKTKVLVFLSQLGIESDFA